MTAETLLAAACRTGLIEPAVLAALLRDPPGDIRLVDASFALPDHPAPQAAFEEERIADAVFFDIDAIAAQDTSLPHMLPDPAFFAARVSALGIGNDSAVIVYDRTGIAMGACRVWWTFRVFGHGAVCVLNGGLPGWKAAALPLETAAPRPPRPATPPFTAQAPAPGSVADRAAVRMAARTGSALILDARPAARFAGTAPEPRPGLRAGHIPGSRNLPFSALLSADGHRLNGADSLRKSFSIWPEEKPLIASCGSGVTACVIAFAAFHTGRDGVSVYDGSWAEWGADKERDDSG